jgi:hypothetical protein
MFKKTFPHREETNVYTSESGYVVIEQHDGTGKKMETMRISMPPDDIPALVEALQEAARLARRNPTGAIVLSSH